jgi:hypothetical protein
MDAQIVSMAVNYFIKLVLTMMVFFLLTRMVARLTQ